MNATKRGVAETYVLSGREFTGTREEILLQLDELIETLAAWRQSLVCSKRDVTSASRVVAGHQARCLVGGLTCS